MVLTLVGGVSPPVPVFSLLFSASYPQARRSYYLFFNYLFFNYLYVYRFMRRFFVGIYRFMRSGLTGRLSVYAWKTGLDHRDLWINLAAAGDQNTVRSPKNNFQWSGTLERIGRRLEGPREASFAAGKGALCSLPWSSLSPDADDLSAFRELCSGHRTACLLAFASGAGGGTS